MILGQDILVKFHDQLDSEVLYYMLKTQSVSSIGQSTFPEFMNGNAVVEVAAPFQIVYYLLLPPVYAFIVNLFVVRIIAFISMYFLLRRFSICNSISFLCSFFFSILPFYSVYGMNIMGIPLLLLTIANLYERKHIFISYLGTAFFALYSSLILIGYVIIFGIILFMIIRLFQKRTNPKEVYIGVFLIIATYSLTSFNLIRSLLHGTDFVSHRSEAIPETRYFWQSLYDMLFEGQYHAVSFHKTFWIVAVLFVFSLLINKNAFDKVEKRNCGLAIGLFFFTIFIAIFYAGFHSDTGVMIRKSIFGNGILLSFQFDRIYWLYPFVWYLMLGLMTSFVVKTLLCNCHMKRLLRWMRISKNKLKKPEKVNVFSKYSITILLCVFLTLICYKNVLNSDVFLNVFGRDQGNDQYLTWREFFATDIFDEIKDYIGDDPSSYRVASIGLYPSIALYNGFQCVDGYSQNYDVEYKHAVYKVIKNELSDDLETYYQDWGNRCYLFLSSAKYDYISFSKEKKTIDCEFDFCELKVLGCNYVFSRFKINNYNEMGLIYLDYFDTDDSSYGVYLYRIQ